MCAMLIAVQLALGFLPGIELVTPLFAAYCFRFGPAEGAVCGAAFSLLRCVIWGFYPSVVLLYLVYYPLFGALFGLLRTRRPPKLLCPFALSAMIALSALGAIFGLPVSRLYSVRLRVSCAVLAAVFAAVLLYYIKCLRSPDSKASALMPEAVSLASAMTVLFTLLDDVITPLLQGYSREAAAAYFYGGFLAMVPQTVCAAVSTVILFPRLTKTRSTDHE